MPQTFGLPCVATPAPRALPWAIMRSARWAEGLVATAVPKPFALSKYRVIDGSQRRSERACASLVFGDESVRGRG